MLWEHKEGQSKLASGIREYQLEVEAAVVYV